MKKTLLSIACGCALLLVSMPSTYAQVKGNPQLKSVSPRQPDISKSTSKVSNELKTLYEDRVPVQARAKMASKPKLPTKGLNKYLQVYGNHVMVDVTIKGDQTKARTELEKIGFKVTAVFGRVMSGRMPIKGLPQLETAATVRFARPAYKPVHQSLPTSSSIENAMLGEKLKPVISQGDTAQRSYLARQKVGRKPIVDGKKVKVGILSDSYNNLGTAAIGVAGGELPGPTNPFNHKKPVQIIKDLDSNGTDEGRAMAEIVHDVAPGAELAFRTAIGGQAEFARGILELALNGCKVIVDDVTYFAEPFFQDGIIAQAVDLVKKNGVTYFSAAGNRSVRSYESDYRATDIEPFGDSVGTAHNFSGPGDPIRIFQPVFIPTGGTFITSFQWDEPFYSASGKGTQSDLDIYLLDVNGNIVAGGISDNLASGDPVEVFGYQNDDPNNNTFFLCIIKYDGPDPTRLKYVWFGDGLFYLTNPEIPGILAPTIIGHAKAEGAIATAAVFWLETPAYGLDTPLVEPFSSLGGVANYFDVNGNRISPLIRKKPEITAPDGGNNSFFFFDILEDADNYPNFFGTSAAAPHAAGVAALMIDAQKLKTITPSQIKGILQSNTYDMDDTFTPGFDKGFDFNTGTGLIKADAAVNKVRFPNRYVKDLDLVSICSDNPSTTRNWKISNPNPFEVRAHWFIIGFQQSGTVTVPAGSEVTFTTKTVYRYNRPTHNIAIIDWQDNFGFPRLDIAFSTGAACGSNLITEHRSDRITEQEARELVTQVNIAEVYPNPSTTKFRLYLSLTSPKNTQLQLYSIDGKQLYNKTVQSNGVIDIDASSYKPGVYMLKVRQGEFNKTIKLIKQ